MNDGKQFFAMLGQPSLFNIVGEVVESLKCMDMHEITHFLDQWIWKEYMGAHQNILNGPEELFMNLVTECFQVPGQVFILQC